MTVSHKPMAQGRALPPQDKPQNRDTAIQQQVRVTSMRTCDQEGAFQTQEPLVQKDAGLMVQVLVVTDGASALTPNDTVLDMQDLEETQSLFTQEVVNGTDCTLCHKKISLNLIEDHYKKNHPNFKIYDEQEVYAQTMNETYEYEPKEGTNSSVRKKEEDLLVLKIDCLP